MKRTYVSICVKKPENFTLYYDYEEDYFFKSKIEKQNPLLPVLSGATGVIVYAFLKNMVFDFGINPLLIVLFSLLVSLLIAYGMAWGTQFLVNKNMHKVEIIHSPSNAEMLSCILDGEKQLKSTKKLSWFLFIFNLAILMFLFFEPNNGLAIICHTILWAIFFFLIWAVRPIKRKNLQPI